MSDTYFTIALDYFKKGETLKAKELCEHILSSNPKDPSVTNLLGLIFWKMEVFDRALQLIQKAMNLAPEKAPIFSYNLAAVYVSQKNTKAAIDVYKKSAEIFEKRGERQEVLNCLELAAFLLKDEKQFEDAKNLYQSILIIDPKNLKAQNNLALIFQQEDKLDDAITLYRKVLDQNPEFTSAYHNLAMAFQQQKKFKEAILLYEKTLELDPNCLEAFINLGNLYRFEERFEDAKTCSEKALSIAPDHPGIYNNLGILFHHQGKLQEAITYYKKALQIAPTYTEVKKNLELAEEDLKEGKV